MMRAMTIIVLSVSVGSTVLSAQEQAKRAIVVGASSGIGRQVAKLLSEKGYTLGLVARREPLLQSLQEELSGPSHIKKMDVADPEARTQLQELIDEMGGLDLLVLSISAYADNAKVDTHAETIDYTTEKLANWEKDERTIDVDFKGFIALAHAGLDYFMHQNHGHLVGISSIGGVRGRAHVPVYSGAKAGISTYMEGMRNYMMQNNINVQISDVVPGYVAVEHSPMGEDPDAYWEISGEEAGQAIVAGIEKKKKVIFVPQKVWFLSLLLEWLPDFAFNRYFRWL